MKSVALPSPSRLATVLIGHNCVLAIRMVDVQDYQRSLAFLLVIFWLLVSLSRGLVLKVVLYWRSVSWGSGRRLL